MISLISDNYNLLQALGSFGISLGFGDKTVRETCESNGVDTHTFLTVVNFTINGIGVAEDDERISVSTLLHYLQASHAYFIDFQLPYIRRELEESLNGDNAPTQLIMKLYDEYAHEIRRHMNYEQKTLFPYVEKLLEGQPASDYNVETFSKHHGAADQQLRELKILIIKYLPQDGLHNNQLTAALHDIYENEEWLSQHALVEDRIFVPAIRRLERLVKHGDVTRNITNMVFKDGPLGRETLSAREKDNNNFAKAAAEAYKSKVIPSQVMTALQTGNLNIQTQPNEKALLHAAYVLDEGEKITEALQVKEKGKREILRDITALSGASSPTKWFFSSFY